MEADIEELWEYYCRKYLDKFGERPTQRIVDRDSLILAIRQLQIEEGEDCDYDYD